MTLSLSNPVLTVHKVGSWKVIDQLLLENGLTEIVDELASIRREQYLPCLSSSSFPAGKVWMLVGEPKEYTDPSKCKPFIITQTEILHA